MKHISVLFKVRSYSARVNLLFVQLLPIAQLAQQNHTRIANMQLKAKRPQRLKLIRSRLSSGALDKENYTNFLSPQDKNPVQLFLFLVLCFFKYHSSESSKFYLLWSVLHLHPSVCPYLCISTYIQFAVLLL